MMMIVVMIMMFVTTTQIGNNDEDGRDGDQDGKVADDSSRDFFDALNSKKSRCILNNDSDDCDVEKM